jgi:hypothetical protein
LIGAALVVVVVAFAVVAIVLVVCDVVIIAVVVVAVIAIFLLALAVVLVVAIVLVGEFFVLVVHWRRAAFLPREARGWVRVATAPPFLSVLAVLLLFARAAPRRRRQLYSPGLSPLFSGGARRDGRRSNDV